jgi:hypothetical protein
MEQNKAANPIDIGLLGAQAVMLDSQVPPHAVEQSGLGNGGRWGSHH